MNEEKEDVSILFLLRENKGKVSVSSIVLPINYLYLDQSFLFTFLTSFYGKSTSNRHQ